MGRLERVALSSIRENPVALREVDRTNEDYLGLVSSMEQKGFIGAISVREQTDVETEETYLELIDGLHRFNAAKDAGLDEIGVDIVVMDDDEVLRTQILANVHRVETKPVQYSQQLKRILNRTPTMTESELARDLGKSTAWIKERLGLTKIENEEIAALIDSGEIGLANAYALAKLPTEEQADWVQRAITEPPDKFVPACSQRVKDIREAKRKGEDPDAPFTPVAFMQKAGDVKDEFANHTNRDTILQESGATTAADGWDSCVAWMLHLDPANAQSQIDKNAQREAEKEENKKRRDAERMKKRATKAAKELEEANAAQATASAAA